jgi:predicted acyltransferase
MTFNTSATPGDDSTKTTKTKTTKTKTKTTKTKTKTPRSISLDVLKGMTIVGMILVNMASLGDTYPWLDHSEWHGLTFADLVFPFFLYIGGVAISYSYAKYRVTFADLVFLSFLYIGGVTFSYSYGKHRKKSKLVTRSVGIDILHRKIPKFVTKSDYVDILWRNLILFGLGLVLNGLFWNYSFTDPKILDLGHLRIMGVLQRIGLASFLAAIAVLNLPEKGQWILTGGILIGYWLIMAFVPAPDNADGVFTQLGNFGAYVDRLIIPKEHLYKGFKYMGDPEGLFSTIPATANVLFGYFTGKWLKDKAGSPRTSITLLLCGLAAIFIGSIWGGFFPINKKLWTSSYTVLTTGWGLVTLAACHELVDVRGYTKWLIPLEAMGKNPLFIFIGSIFQIKLLMMNKIGSGDKAISIYEWSKQGLFGWAGALNSGVLYAIATILLWTGIAYIMYRKKWLVKI